ncbi:MAG: alpha/beta hydrolase [bacterium]|nr:alpha/beta hydrolase [bacterium]
MLSFLRKQFLLAAFVGAVTFITGVFSVASAQAAIFSLSPAAQTFRQECDSVVNMLIDTQGQMSNAADAVVLFNPNEIEIQEVQEGSLYEMYPGNQIDTSAGRILMTGFSVLHPYNSTGAASTVFGSIIFRSKPGVTSTTLRFDFTPGASRDSNVASLESDDLLTGVTNGSYTFELGSCVDDTVPAYAYIVIPNPGTRNVPLDSNVVIHLRDNMAGVDLSTVVITINGVEYHIGDPGVTVMGDAFYYIIMIDPPEDFLDGVPVHVSVDASDLVGNVMNTYEYSFNEQGLQGEQTPPPSAEPPPSLPPTTPSCGNGIVESGEQCEPPGSLVCDTSCQVLVDVCIPPTETEQALQQDVVSRTIDAVYTGLAESDTVGWFVVQMNDLLNNTGLVQIPEEAGGVHLVSVDVETLACHDRLAQTPDIQRLAFPYEPPPDFEIIDGPFQLDCDPGPYQTTLSLPDNFSDVRAVKCVGGECEDVLVTVTDQITCQQDEIIRQGVKLAEIQRVEVTPVDRSDLENSFRSFSDRYHVAPLGEPSGRSYSVDFFPGGFDGYIHPSLKVLSAPIVVTRSGPLLENQEERVLLSLPYSKDVHIPDAGVQMFILDPSSKVWFLLGESVNRTDRLVLEQEIDYQRFVDDQGRIVLATMGIVQRDPGKSYFEKVYDPLSGDRAAVVLIHGLNSDPGIWDPFISDIRDTRQPWQVWTFGYPFNDKIATSAKEFAYQLEAHADEYDVLYLVAHSLGGLITQEALDYAYRENAITPGRFSFLEKTRKLIMIGTPNDKVETKGVLLQLYNYMLSTGNISLFGLEDTSTQELLMDRPQIPQVPGIEYFSIAGDREFQVDLGITSVGAGMFLNLGGKNDGIVSIASAQHVGGAYLDQQCKNFWELGADHVGLIVEAPTRKVIGQLISQDIGQYLENVALLGHQQYFSLAEASCTRDDRYILIGKSLDERKVADTTGCLCGNGFCGFDEDAVTCPLDCATFFRAENYGYFFWPLLLVLLIIILSVLWRIYKRIRRHYGEKAEKKRLEKKGRRK